MAVDLSILSPEERAIIAQHPSVLTDGSMAVALYLRYSSDRQTEQSIEGQLRDAVEYCFTRNVKISSVYIDRATSASKDIKKRTQFLRMIADAEKHTFSAVLVWKLDRFARSRTDSAIYKQQLKAQGVRVISVTEEISDSPEGIILEALLEGMAEFYSAELSQKITRGMRETALKHQSNGGRTPWGYRIEAHRLVPDPLEAPLVKQAFEMYAAGASISDICREYNTKGHRPKYSKTFTRSSFNKMFGNAVYIGTYHSAGIEAENAVPAIIDRELFDAVQQRLADNKKAPGRGKAKVEYLLSGKIFCGHCGAQMDGESGVGRGGQVYNYYKCFTRKRGGTCDKRAIRKEVIEEWVVQDAMQLMTDKVIEELADIAIKQSEDEIAHNSEIPALAARLAEIDKAVNNITAAIERGAVSDALLSRLNDLSSERQNVAQRLSDAEAWVSRPDRAHIIYFLHQFVGGDVDDPDFRRRLVGMLVNSVTVWDLPDGDFEITTVYNLSSAKSSTFRASQRGGECFGFCAEQTTKDAKSEPKSEPLVFVIGLYFAQTKKHAIR